MQMAVSLAVAETKVAAAGAMLAMVLQHQQTMAGAANPSTPAGSAGPSVTPMANPFTAFFANPSSN